jgi:hypothetical protein
MKAKNFRGFRIALMLLAQILLIGIVSALTINIDVPASFSFGERLYFNYTISSDTGQEITFIPNIICQDAPVAPMQQKSINLQKNVPYNGIYIDMEVNEMFKRPACSARIMVLSPVQQTISKDFAISLQPSFSFDIKLNKVVFMKKEDIEITYDSSVSNPEITATLISPSGKSREIQLPGKFKLDEIGTYTINAQASKQGYKNVSASKQIGVIEEDANIQAEDESVQQDRQEIDNPTTFYIILTITGVLIILIGFVIYKLVRRHKV